MMLETQEEENSCTYVFLKLLAKYRCDLKHFQIACNLFDKIRLLNEQENDYFKDQDEPIYQLLTSNEIAELGNAEIANHCIVNMAIRGIPSLVNAINNNDEKPEEYLNTHFFKPVQEMVNTYAANIVMLKNSKLVVNFHEYVNEHENWCSVSLACGFSQQLLDLISRMNANSRANNYPDLGVSIGISFDENVERVIAVQGRAEVFNIDAFSTAELLSHSTESDVPADIINHFNAHVSTGKDYFLNVSREQKVKDMLGTQTLQNTIYNYNGILISQKTFNKLNAEMSLHIIQLEIGEKNHIFHFISYEINGKTTELWVREGSSFRSKNDEYQQPASGSIYTYYELVQNPETLEIIRQKVNRQRQQMS